MKLHSERLFLKYLVSDHGACFGADVNGASYLLLISSRGLVWQRRPAGDRVVEDLDFEIPAIARALEHDTVPA